MKLRILCFYCGNNVFEKYFLKSRSPCLRCVKCKALYESKEAIKMEGCKNAE